KIARDGYSSPELAAIVPFAQRAERQCIDPCAFQQRANSCRRWVILDDSLDRVVRSLSRDLQTFPTLGRVHVASFQDFRTVRELLDVAIQIVEQLFECAEVAIEILADMVH